MKKLTAAFLLLSSFASATPYFKLIDPSHPQPVLGALVDPVHLGNSSAASLLPLVTHSPKDGCLLPSIVCEDWTPVAVGGSMNAGKITFDVAPLANVIPWVQSAALSVVPARWVPLVKVLTPSTDQSVTFSCGPVWEYSQAQNKGYFKVFTGLKLSF
jgi:hypothetical protein